VTFIRHRATIEAEFRDGWSALAIYERHKKCVESGDKGLMSSTLHISSGRGFSPAN